MGNRKKFHDSYEKVTCIDLTIELEDDEDEYIHQKPAERDVIGKHRTCWKHTIANLKARKLKRRKATLDRFEVTSPCFLDEFPFPHRKRSPREGSNSKRISNQLKEECSGLTVCKTHTLKTKCDLPTRGVSCRDSTSMKMHSGKFELYMENLWKRFSEDKMNSFAYIDSLWFLLYMQGKSDVMSWIKKRRIFSKKYVIVPIVCWSHWSLLIFCHFGENLQSNSKKPCMLLLDSLEKADPRRLEPYIRKFVLGIYEEEGRPETKEKIYKIPLLIPKVPQQRDDKECGNFVLYYISLFVEAAPETFSIGSYPYFMKKDWFTVEGVDRFSKWLDTIPLEDD